jgi:pimeloyl-ACP methyl ester carboxylesterase
MQVFADDLAWICERLGLHKPVVIGHSMGGVVALAVGYPDVPSAIVILDAPVVRPFEGRAAMQRFLEQLRGASYHDYQELMRGFVSNILFIHTDDQERIAQQMSSSPSMWLYRPSRAYATSIPPRRAEGWRCQPSTWRPTSRSQARTWLACARCSRRSSTRRPWALGTSAS